jgi:hypothetical protein
MEGDKKGWENSLCIILEPTEREVYERKEPYRENQP